MAKSFNNIDSFSTQAAALNLRASRQSVIAGNIANADTPNYKARDFNFANALNTALGKLPQTGALTMNVSQPNHLSGKSSGLPVALQYRAAATENIDGNSVDMDRERAQFADNTMRYEAALRSLNGTIKTLQSAIQSQ